VTGFSGSADVEVQLTPNGTLAMARITKSSGNFMVDKAALAAVRASTFRSETVDCVPVGGSYVVTASFD
jgi:TonB family protein